VPVEQRSCGLVLVSGGPDQWAEDERLSRVGQSAPLDMGVLSRADLADFLVKQINDDAFVHKTPVLTR